MHMLKTTQMYLLIQIEVLPYKPVSLDMSEAFQILSLEMSNVAEDFLIGD